ncbi:hypothetical protein E4U41_005020, partial [Claviceps citrina]
MRRPRRHRSAPAAAAAAAAASAAALGFATMQLPVAAAHVFPYVPTQILMPAACWDESTCDGADLAYVFSQTDGGSVRFSALDYSDTVAADNARQLAPITTELPFLKDEPATTAFGAVRTSNGSVLVLSGACDGTTGSLWSYSTQMGAKGGGSAWRKGTMTRRRSPAYQVPRRGPYFLGGTLAFSSRLAPTMDQPTIYTYGGVCLAPGTDPTGWQSGANYTTTMLSLAPEKARSADKAAAYSLGVVDAAASSEAGGGGGPRTPLAGFTLTELPASTTNMSGSVTQQAGFVLLGGHTQQAFINMSTAAVWNLPDQTWSYIDIGAPDSSSSSSSSRAAALHAPRDDNSQVLNWAAVPVPEVESRSGHTAVLAEDGASIVVFGGWVGDVGTPAEPQLVVLQLGETYSSWRWTVPPAQPPDGKGVYGHGAAMLPGNVMMVLGGWETEAAARTPTTRTPTTRTPTTRTPTTRTPTKKGKMEKKEKKRQASGGGAGALRFLNLTSLSWSDSYTNPAPAKAARGGGGGGVGVGGTAGGGGQGAGDDDDDGSEHARRLGVGLGVGFALLLLAVVATACVCRARREKNRRCRDEAMQPSMRMMMGRDDGTGYPWLHAAASSSSRGYEALGGQAGASSRLDDGPGGRVAVMARTPVNALVSPPGRIHPIMEDDEPTTPTMSDGRSNPFKTPTSATAPRVVFFPPSLGGRAEPAPGPGPGRGPYDDHHHHRHDPDVQDWVSDVDAADSLLDRYSNYSSLRRGRLSPRNEPRDDESRSGSNLSESNRSAVDSLGRSPSRSRRGMGVPIPTGGGLLVADPPKPDSASSSSYNTARSSFGTLQAEGPALLSLPSDHPAAAAAAAAAARGRDGDAVHAEQEEEEEEQAEEGGEGEAEEEHLDTPTSPTTPSSPSKSKPRRRWLGSLSRVFSHSGRAPPPLLAASPERSVVV